jgi:S-adenosylmethionine hydrolase
MKTRIITITDCSDVASNEIRASIISTLEKVNAEDRVEIEPFIFCKEFSLVNGAFMIRLLAESYNPQNTVFLVIVNGLSTARVERARIVGCTKNGFRFVGENTGALSWLTEDFGVKTVFDFSRQGLDGKDFISFGGKYFHAPKAALIASGENLFQEGNIVFPESRLASCYIPEGMVVHVDNFGVSKIKQSFSQIKEGDQVKVFVNGEFFTRAIFTNSMKNLPDNTWAVYKGSSFGLTEFGCVRNVHASKSYINIEDIITFQKGEM